MEDKTTEKTQWHPFLVQFLRHDYKEKLVIKEAFKLGKMPLEMDMLIQPKVPSQLLPYPFNCLAETTLVEFKGPGDEADWKAVSQIEGYACLYQRREKIEDRREITLWIVANKFAENFNQFPCDYIDNLTQIGKGVSSGELTRFSICLIDLGKLPITVYTIPLLMVYKDNPEREKEIIRFVIKHYGVLKEYLEFLSTLHIKAYKEVLADMNIKNLHELDLDWEEIYDFLGFVIHSVGDEKAIEKIIQTAGPEKVIESIGIEKVEELLQKVKKEKTA